MKAISILAALALCLYAPLEACAQPLSPPLDQASWQYAQGHTAGNTSPASPVEPPSSEQSGLILRPSGLPGSLPIDQAAGNTSPASQGEPPSSEQSGLTLPPSGLPGSLPIDQAAGNTSPASQGEPPSSDQSGLNQPPSGLPGSLPIDQAAGNTGPASQGEPPSSEQSGLTLPPSELPTPSELPPEETLEGELPPEELLEELPSEEDSWFQMLELSFSPPPVLRYEVDWENGVSLPLAPEASVVELFIINRGDAPSVPLAFGEGATQQTDIYGGFTVTFEAWVENGFIIQPGETVQIGVCRYSQTTGEPLPVLAENQTLLLQINLEKAQ